MLEKLCPIYRLQNKKKNSRKYRLAMSPEYINEKRRSRHSSS